MEARQDPKITRTFSFHKPIKSLRTLGAAVAIMAASTVSQAAEAEVNQGFNGWWVSGAITVLLALGLYLQSSRKRFI